MKRRGVALIALLYVVTSTSLLAQEEIQNRLGLGISLDLGRLGQNYYIYDLTEGFFLLSPVSSAPPVVFYLPIRITSRLRCEPSFGFYSTGISSTQYSQTSSYDASFVTFGFRAAYISPLTDQMALYVGPRLDINLVSSTSENSYTPPQRALSTSKETDVTVGLVFGAEYFPISQFSVGGEASVNYTSFGDPDFKTENFPMPPGSTYIKKREQHATRTDALFLVRWYFL